MLKGECINPEINEVLAYLGHGSKILIVDANYPLREKSGDAKKIYLGLRRGIPTSCEVLSTLHSAINIESAEMMIPTDGSKAECVEEFRGELCGIPIKTLDRFEFYSAAMAPNAVALAISTGEQRTFGCILITVGCA